MREVLRGEQNAAGSRRFVTSTARRLVSALGTIAAVAAGLTMSQSAAHAQALPPGEQRDFAVSAGIFIPTNSYIRSVAATEIPEVEADYTIQKFPESNFISQLGVAYIEHGPFRMIPITVSQLYRDKNNSSGFDYYYGLGVGVYSTRLTTADVSGGVKNLVGGDVVAGLDISRTVFAELKYDYIGKYDNKFVGGTQINLGIRF